MSTLSTRKIKHDSSSIDNITLGSTGRVSIKSPGADGLVLETDTADSTCSTRIFAKNNTYTGGMYYDDTGWNITTGSSIGSASGSPKLNITREGYIKTPNQPAFYAMSNNNTFTSTQAITFEDVYVNRGSCYNSANGRFTAPVAGTYHFSANFLKRGGSGRLLFHRNDTYYGSGNSQAFTSVNETMLAATIIITLAVNDYITVIGSIDAGDVYGNSNSHNGFSGFLIG
jgi:hypothetical protein